MTYHIPKRQKNSTKTIINITPGTYTFIKIITIISNETIKIKEVIISNTTITIRIKCKLGGGTVAININISH